MQTIFLRFPDQATFEALLPAGAKPVGETYDKLPDGITALSIIGNLYTGGTFDAQGNVLTAPTQVPGWHVNALASEYTPVTIVNAEGKTALTMQPVIPVAFKQYSITPDPSTPSRVFG